MATESSVTVESSDRGLIEKILNEYASIPYAHGNLEAQTIFDRDKGRYLLLTLGWDGHKRVHGVIVDVELRGGKFWIHQDGTEVGIAKELELNGIPKDHIVLAWLPESARKYSEFAVK